MGLAQFSGMGQLSSVQLGLEQSLCEKGIILYLCLY